VRTYPRQREREFAARTDKTRNSGKKKIKENNKKGILKNPLLPQDVERILKAGPHRRRNKARQQGKKKREYLLRKTSSKTKTPRKASGNLFSDGQQPKGRIISQKRRQRVLKGEEEDM